MAEGTEPPATQRNDSHLGPAPWVGFCFRQWGLGCGGPTKGGGLGPIRQGVGPGRGTGGCPTHAILPHSREGVGVSSLHSVLALYEPLKKRARPAGQSNRRVEARPGYFTTSAFLAHLLYCGTPFSSHKAHTTLPYCLGDVHQAIQRGRIASFGELQYVLGKLSQSFGHPSDKRDVEAIAQAVDTVHERLRGDHRLATTPFLPPVSIDVVATRGRLPEELGQRCVHRGHMTLRGALRWMQAHSDRCAGMETACPCRMSDLQRGTEDDEAIQWPFVFWGYGVMTKLRHSASYSDSTGVVVIWRRLVEMLPMTTAQQRLYHPLEVRWTKLVKPLRLARAQSVTPAPDQAKKVFCPVIRVAPTPGPRPVIARPVPRKRLRLSLVVKKKAT